jgi:putative FmdB family regulatory protein
MPIYAYRCASCGHTKDVLQKIADAPLTVCPACGASTFAKQLTAAGFQLKGSGWYATDFKGGNGAKKPDSGSDAGKTDSKSDTKTDTKTDTAKSGDTSSSSKSGDAGSGSSTAPKAAGCGGACACH